MLVLFQCILGGVNFAAERFDSKFFERFRSQNIVETAVEYAQVMYTYENNAINKTSIAVDVVSSKIFILWYHEKFATDDILKMYCSFNHFHSDGLLHTYRYNKYGINFNP